MNKNLYYIFIIAFSIFSCQNNDDLLGGNSNSGWVQFNSENTIGDDFKNRIRIPISIPVGDNNNRGGLNVGYKIEAISDNVPSEYTGDFTTNVKQFDKNGYIEFIPFDISEPYEIKFTLTSVSNTDYSVGLSDNSKITSHNLTVCHADTIGDNYIAISSIGGTGVLAFQPSITKIDSLENTYDLESAWGKKFIATATGNSTYEDQFIYPATMKINKDLSVIITPKESDAAIDYATGGVGTYDPCSKKISYDLNQTILQNQDDELIVVGVTFELQ